MGVSALELRRRVLMAQPHKERKTGGIVSFDTHVPQVLDVSVPLSPVQAGTGDPYPPGGGKNMIDFDRVVTEITNTPAVYLTPGTYYIYVANDKTLAFNSFALISTDGVTFAAITTNTESQNAYASQTMGYNVKKCIVTVVNPVYLYVRIQANANLSGATVKVLLTKDETNYNNIPNGFYSDNAYFTQIWTPYSNIRPISGHTGAAVWRTGRNLMQTPPFGVSAAQVNDFGADFQFDAITFSFKANNTIAQYTNAAVVDLREENGTHHYITLSNCKNSEGRTFKANTETSGIYSKTLTNIKFRYVYAYYTGTSYSKFNGDNVTEWQIEPGATASEYAPYSGESFPFTFPNTVYGGRLEPAAGVLTVDMVLFAFKDLVALNGASARWVYNSAYNIFETQNAIIPTGTANTETGIICSCYQSRPYGYNGSYSSENSIVWAHTSGTLRIKDNRYTDVDVWKTAIADEQIAVPLAEPLIVPLTPAEIRALMGENNVFADTGDVDVEFWTN